MEENGEMEVKVKWKSLARAAYAYGSQVSFEEHQVIFYNPQMPPSFPITQWHSLSNFQGYRKQPELPLLERGKTYTINLFEEVFPQGSTYLRITCFNRFGEVVEVFFIKEMTGQFTYPEEAFSYTIELLNSGCERVVFKHFIISDGESDSPAQPRTFERMFPKPTNRVTILLVEPNKLPSELAIPEKLQEMGNLILVDYLNDQDRGYSMAEFEETLKTYLSQEFDDTNPSLNFVGYGPVGNFFSCFYASRFRARAYITTVIGPKEFYKKFLYGPIEALELIIESVFNFRKNSYRVSIYKEAEIQQEHSLLCGVMDYSELLQSYR